MRREPQARPASRNTRGRQVVLAVLRRMPREELDELLEQMQGELNDVQALIAAIRREIARKR